MNVPGYKIERLIGRGGMAAVYLAIQESLARPVALKVMLPGFADAPEFSERFLNEGRIIAALNHPNIITIHDIGIADDGHYISMEYVDGGDLRQRIADGVTPEAALAVLEVMGGCLRFAHQRHIVHRDVKPGNILFRRSGAPLLTDFGIAKHLQEGIDRTVTGTVMGSPHYLSPEQARGEPVDGRSDLYSLGIILFEMLTGEKPFRGETDVSIIFQHLQQPVPRLPAKLGRFQPLLDRMLAKQPAERFEDAKAMVEFVRGMPRGGKARADTGKRGRDARGVARSAGDKSPTSPRRSWRGRTWAALAAGGLLAGAAVLALGPKPWSRGTPQVVPSVAAKVAPRPDLPLKRREATGPGEKRPAQTRPSPPGEKPVAVPKAHLSPGEADKAEASRPKPATVAKVPPPPRPAPTERAKPAVSRHSDKAHTARSSVDGHLAKFSPPKRKTDRRVDKLIRLADAALKGSRLTTPAGDNAYEYYRKVLALDPANRRAKQGITKIADRYAGLAEGSLAKDQYAKAQHYVALGLKVQPTNRRLRQLRKTDRRVDKLIRLADAALKDYRLTTPAGDNAYEYYRKVLALDPANRRAKQGITKIADRYAGLAEGSLAKYQYGKAQHYVALGLKVQPDNRRLRQLRRDVRWQNAPTHLWNDIQHGVKDIGGDIKGVFGGF